MFGKIAERNERKKNKEGKREKLLKPNSISHERLCCTPFSLRVLLLLQQPHLGVLARKHWPDARGRPREKEVPGADLHQRVDVPQRLLREDHHLGADAGLDVASPGEVELEGEVEVSRRGRGGREGDPVSERGGASEDLGALPPAWFFFGEVFLVFN